LYIIVQKAIKATVWRYQRDGEKQEVKGQTIQWTNEIRTGQTM